MNNNTTNSKPKSLRSKVVLLATISALATFLFIGCAIYGYSYFELKSNIRRNTAELMGTIDAQARKLTVGFLLKEQKLGQSALLRNYQESEQLSRIEIIPLGKSIPEFPDCPKLNTAVNCVNHQTNKVAVLTPLSDGDQTHGYLLKVRDLDAKTLSDEALIVSILLVVTLSSTFIILLILLTRLTSIQVPRYLKLLTTWIDSSLNTGTSTEPPHSNLSELDTLANSLKNVLDRHSKMLKENQAMQEKILVAKVSQQVAHDIRSPLSALTVVANQHSNSLTENSRILLKSAIDRIMDITNELSTSNSNHTNKKESRVEPLSGLIESVLTEKRYEYRSAHGITITGNLSNGYGAFSLVSLSDFKRILSNLVNNAVESLGEEGRVDIDLKKTDNKNIVEVRDNGKGIPSSMIKKVFEEGFSFGKPKGTGLGLSHAKHLIEAWGGSIRFESKKDQGSIIRIELPAQTSPEWYAPSVTLNETDEVIILDDDKAIHEIWRQRFQKVGKRSHHFYSATDLRTWIAKKQNLTGLIAFIDFQFRDSEEDGIDLATRMNFCSQRYIVTSNFENQEIQSRCIEFGLKLIPKPWAPLVPLV